MKKLLTIVTTALIAIAVVSCNSEEKPNNEEVRKLPSRVSEHNIIADLTHNTYYLYDEQNRLIRMIRFDTFDISYRSDGKPEKVLRNGSPMFVFEFVGNQVFVGGDFPVFTLSNRGQVLRHYYYPATTTYHYTFSENGSLIKIYTYMLAGSDSLFRINENKIIPSNVPAIFRHVNTPEWLLWLLPSRLPYKYGYMPATIETAIPIGEEQTIILTTTTQFQLNADGYAIEITWFDNGETTPVVRHTIEYIFAN